MDKRLLEAAIDRVLEEFPEERREAMRLSLGAGLEAAERREGLTAEFLALFDNGRRNVSLEDFNEKQAESLEQLAIEYEAICGPVAQMHGGSAVGPMLVGLQIATASPCQLPLALAAAGEVGCDYVSILIDLGMAEICKRAAEIARAARTEKASRANAN